MSKSLVKAVQSAQFVTGHGCVCCGKTDYTTNLNCVQILEFKCCKRGRPYYRHTSCVPYFVCAILVCAILCVCHTLCVPYFVCAILCVCHTCVCHTLCVPYFVCAILCVGHTLCVQYFVCAILFVCHTLCVPFLCVPYFVCSILCVCHIKSAPQELEGP